MDREWNIMMPLSFLIDKTSSILSNYRKCNSTQSPIITSIKCIKIDYLSNKIFRYLTTISQIIDYSKTKKYNLNTC